MSETSEKRLFFFHETHEKLETFVLFVSFVEKRNQSHLRHGVLVHTHLIYPLRPPC